MKIEIDEKYLPLLSAALIELPYRAAAPLISEINQQIADKKKNEFSTPLDENGVEIK